MVRDQRLGEPAVSVWRQEMDVAGSSEKLVIAYQNTRHPTGGMDAFLLWVLCVVRQRCVRRTDHSSRGVLPNVLCNNNACTNNE